ncbi:nickel/cobalt efflux transporter [Methylocystis sp.]|uniref:nickel/cobalt efflux transporter n=1 Tax=Methylocystis sp. TaxID=1911079 RepID=UPI0027328BDE|nr:nickel/cobalt efflux transporter [Methylocystis sp.]MDP3553441.1 nickel/cobalt efflux transporter [Methylocystis sp.]
MSDLSEVFRAGAANAWIFAPSAVALGALHGLEPGHSKTMMAAFIVAVRGTVAQAVLLGLAATISHTAIVWAVALTGLYLGAQLNVEANEPYLQIVSGVLIIAVALWMIWRSWRDIAAKGAMTASARESGLLPAGASAAHGHPHDGAHVHEHVHVHDGGVPHSHQEEEFESELLDVDPTVYADAHERAHALDIERRFASRHVTTGQIILFGLTGGLIPCPASITVLLLCLQVGRVGLGALLVLCFSVGLALTLVLVGVAAALGMRHAASRWPGLEALAARAPYVSGAIVAAVGAYTIATGAAALA